MTSRLKEVRLLVCGIGGSGKRNLCTRFESNLYLENYDPTGGGGYRKQHQVDDTAYLIDFDTVREVDTDLIQQRCRDADAFILVYAITSKESINQLRPMHAKLIEQQQGQKPIFLVGTKLDLEPQRQVSLEEARAVAIELNCRKWFEVSAKDQTDEINDIFTKLVRETQRLQQTGSYGTQATPQRTTTNDMSDAAALSPESTLSSSPRKNSSMLERFKFGSLKRKGSIQSLVRKKSGSFSASIMSFGSDARPSKDQPGVMSPSGTKNGPPYKLDVDTSAWRETVKWPTEIIPE